MNQREKKSVGVRFKKCWSTQHLSESKRVPYRSAVNTPLPPHSGVHIFNSAWISTLRRRREICWQDWSLALALADQTGLNSSLRYESREREELQCSSVVTLSWARNWSRDATTLDSHSDRKYFDNNLVEICIICCKLLSLNLWQHWLDGCIHWLYDHSLTDAVCCWGFE